MLLIEHSLLVSASPTWQSNAHTALEGSESVNYYFEVSGWEFLNEGGEEQGVEEGKSFCLDRLSLSLFTPC